MQLGQRLDDLVQPGDVRMVQSLHAGDLARQQALRLGVQLGLVQYLHRNFVCNAHRGDCNVQRAAAVLNLCLKHSGRM